jgi:hypothetical protein
VVRSALSPERAVAGGAIVEDSRSALIGGIASPLAEGGAAAPLRCSAVPCSAAALAFAANELVSFVFDDTSLTR